MTVTAIRDFIWITVKERATGNPYSEGYWSDRRDIQAQVIDAETGNTVTRDFRGAIGLIEGPSISKGIGLQVRQMNFKFAGVADHVQNLLRSYDPDQGKITIYRTEIDPISRLVVGVPEPEFYGFINTMPIVTPAAGGESSITLSCVSHMQEGTRQYNSKRTDADQRLRDPSDGCYQHVATVGEWQINWQQ